MHKSKLLHTLCSFSLIVGVSGCLGSGAQSSQQERNDIYTNALTQYYARGIEQYALQSITAITSAPDWRTGAYATIDTGKIVNFTDLGGYTGTAEGFSKSGYCLTDPANPSELIHITWFKSQDLDDFLLAGLGNRSSAAIAAVMADRAGDETHGTYRDDHTIELLGSNTTLALPDDCNALGITFNSPVLISYIGIPQLPQSAVTKTEFTTVACETGKVGHYLLSLDVTYLANGDKIIAGQIQDADKPLPAASHIQSETVWTVVEANCQDELILSEIATKASMSKGVDLHMASNTGIGGSIVGNLGSIGCRKARLQKDAMSKDHSDRKNTEADRHDGADPSSYDTCAETVKIEDTEAVSDTRLGLLGTEVHRTDCGGNAGAFMDSVGGFAGNARHEAWIGEAVYNRKVFLQKTNNIKNASAQREERESWHGESIHCQRREDLIIACNTGYPSLSGFHLLDDRGFHFGRTNRIDGWADSVNIQPNRPENPVWEIRRLASRCQWREDTTWGCSVGSEGQTQEGMRRRSHLVTRLNKNPKVGPWRTVQPAICEDRRTSSRSCGAGKTGRKKKKQVRLYTSVSPGTGTWGRWETVSRSDNCRRKADNSSGSPSSPNNNVYLDIDRDGVGDFASVEDYNVFAEQHDGYRTIENTDGLESAVFHDRDGDVNLTLEDYNRKADDYIASAGGTFD